MRDKVIFYFARLFGLFAKLGLILFITEYEFQSADDITRILILTPAFFIILNSNAHFDLYNKTFNPKKDDKADINELVNKYIENSTLHYFIFVIPIILVLIFLTRNPILSLLISVNITIEKLYDEYLRFNLFAKNYNKWSKAFLFKNALAYSVGLASIFFVEDSAALFITSTILMNIPFLLITISDQMKYRLMIACSNMNFTGLKNYLKVYRTNLFQKQLYSILTGNVYQIDKILISSLPNINFLTTYYLMSQFANGVNILVDLFYISTNRSELMLKRLDLKSFFVDKKLNSILIASSILVILCYCIYKETSSSITVDLHMIIIYLLGIVFFSITKPVGQNLFWNTSIKSQIFIELFYFMIVLTAIITASKQGNLNPLILSLVFTTAMIVRLILYARNFKRFITPN